MCINTSNMDNAIEPVQEETYKDIECEETLKQMKAYAEKKRTELYDFSKTEEGQAYYYNLAGCECCPRHMHKKPGWMENGWVESRFHYTFVGDPGMYCSCNCRNIMRSMARLYNPNQDHYYPPDYCHPVCQEVQTRNE